VWEPGRARGQIESVKTSAISRYDVSFGKLGTCCAS
jgi:hypothetical protein